MADYNPPNLDGLDASTKLIILDAINQLLNTVPLEKLQVAIRENNVERLLGEMNFGGFKSKLAGLNEKFARAYINGAKHAGVQDAKYIMDLTKINQRAVEYAQTKVGKLIQAITDDVRQTVRDTVGRSMSGELTYTQVARQLKSSIGLHPKWADAVSKYEARQIERLLSEGETLTVATERASGLSARYADKLESLRAMTIARTEIITSANNGLIGNWQEAIDKGFAEAGSLKQWNAEPDACPDCAEIDDATAPLDEPFTYTDKGDPIYQPSYHPNCRCSMSLVPPDKANPYDNSNADNLPDGETA